jgi:hypothetical protein
MAGVLIGILIWCCLVWTLYYFVGRAPRTNAGPRTEMAPIASSDDEPVVAAIAEEVVGQVVGALIDSAVDQAVGDGDHEWIIDDDG